MRIDPKSPRSRVDMPMRRMEYTIHQILQETGLGGQALCEARVYSEAREVDFAVGLEGVARFAIEVKGAGTRLTPTGGT